MSCSSGLPEDKQYGQFSVTVNFRSRYCHPFALSKDRALISGHLSYCISLKKKNAGDSVAENSNGKELERVSIFPSADFLKLILEKIVSVQHDQAMAPLILSFACKSLRYQYRWPHSSFNL